MIRIIVTVIIIMMIIIILFYNYKNSIREVTKTNKTNI